MLKKIQLLPESKFRPGYTDLPIFFIDIVRRMPNFSQAAAWVLMLTGVRSGSEYVTLRAEHLDHNEHSVWVPGTKTDGSMAKVYVHPQFWPWIVAGVPAVIGHRRLCGGTSRRPLAPQAIRS